MIIKQGNGKPAHFTFAQKMSPRSFQIKEALESSETTMLSSEDTPETIIVLMGLVKNLDSLIPTELHSACQSALALNQTTGLGRKIGGTTVKGPTTLVKSLLRYL